LGNAEFKQAVALDPDSVPAMLNVAGIAVNVQDYPLALEQYEKVLALEPNNIEAYLSKAVALRGLDRLDEAEKIYRDIISKHPEYPQAQFNLNVLYQEYYQKTDEARTMWAAFVENPQAQKIIPGRVEEAKTRIKQIDETKAAAEKAAADAARMQAEMEELERMAREAEAAEAAEAAQSGDGN
jgi:tetratricopeptide (TPR) repeat protein